MADEQGHIVVYVVEQLLFQGGVAVPWDELVHLAVQTEYHFQNRDDQREGEDVEYGGEYVEYHRTGEIAPVRRDEPFDYRPELFHNRIYRSANIANNSHHIWYSSQCQMR